MSEKLCMMCKRNPVREEGKPMCASCYSYWNKLWDWQNKSEKDGMVCPYCDYEFEEREREYEEGTTDVTCPCCGKEFEIEVSCLWTWTSRKRGADFVEVEEEGD